MKQPSIEIDRKNKMVTIKIPLEKPHPSKSTGKTRVIATTGGLRTSGESYARRPVCFTANVFFFPPSPMSADEGNHSATNEAPPSTTKNRDRGRDRSTAKGSAEK
jgi:hypothetical protein